MFDCLFVSDNPLSLCSPASSDGFVVGAAKRTETQDIFHVDIFVAVVTEVGAGEVRTGCCYSAGRICCIETGIVCELFHHIFHLSKRFVHLDQYVVHFIPEFVCIL